MTLSDLVDYVEDTIFAAMQAVVARLDEEDEEEEARLQEEEDEIMEIYRF